MAGSVLLIAILLTPVLGWMLLRRHLAMDWTDVPLGHVRLVYTHWSLLALFALFGALNSWSGSQLLVLVYLVVIAAPGALVASFMWRLKRTRVGLERTLWWATAMFAPAVALLIGVGYLAFR
jgi:hypothetical protein